MLIKVLLALIVKLAIVGAAVYWLWPTPKAPQVPQRVERASHHRVPAEVTPLARGNHRPSRPYAGSIRRDQGEILVKSRRIPPPGFPPHVTIAITILCTLVFLARTVLDEAARWDMLLGFSMIPAVVTGDRVLPAAIPTLGATFSVI